MQEAIGLPLNCFLQNQKEPHNFKIHYLLADNSHKNDKNRIPRIVKIVGNSVYVSMFLNTAPKEIDI
ncbi:MAG: hypothetical protein Q4E07_03025 [Eubacteriales bacterium]|nr:hypothetical protein [Eubacteriales bacterium]